MPQPQPTSFTIAIDTPEAMARMAQELAGFPVIKVKLGGDDDDEDRLAAIRSARPDARLRVDANAGWSIEVASEYLRRMEAYDLEMIEQPLAKEAIVEMGLLQSRTHIPIVADESVQSLADVERLADAGRERGKRQADEAGRADPGAARYPPGARARPARDAGLHGGNLHRHHGHGAPDGPGRLV